MPRFVFAFKWAYYAKVPLYCTLHSSADWNGEEGQRVREGGARQQNTPLCKFISKNFNFAREIRPDGYGKRAR